MYIAKLIFFNNFKEEFDYQIPDDLEGSIKPGVFVLAPLKEKKLEIAVVWRIEQNTITKNNITNELQANHRQEPVQISLSFSEEAKPKITADINTDTNSAIINKTQERDEENIVGNNIEKIETKIILGTKTTQKLGTEKGVKCKTAAELDKKLKIDSKAEAITEFAIKQEATSGKNTKTIDKSTNCGIDKNIDFQSRQKVVNQRGTKHKLKYISKIITNGNIKLNEHFIRFINFVAEYNMQPRTLILHFILNFKYFANLLKTQDSYKLNQSLYQMLISDLKEFTSDKFSADESTMDKFISDISLHNQSALKNKSFTNYNSVKETRDYNNIYYRDCKDISYHKNNLSIARLSSICKQYINEKEIINEKKIANRKIQLTKKEIKNNRVFYQE